MDGGNTYVYDFSELREDVQALSTEVSKQHETMIQQNETIIKQNETIITDLTTISENQGNIIVLDMLVIGLLGIIIGICFVNIFKSR